MATKQNHLHWFSCKLKFSECQRFPLPLSTQREVIPNSLYHSLPLQTTLLSLITEKLNSSE